MYQYKMTAEPLRFSLDGAPGLVLFRFTQLYSICSCLAAANILDIIDDIIGDIIYDIDNIDEHL